MKFSQRFRAKLPASVQDVYEGSRQGSPAGTMFRVLLEMLDELEDRALGAGAVGTSQEEEPVLEEKTCRSCGAAIIWTVTTSGRKMPLDASPTPKGNYRITAGEKGPLAVPDRSHGRYTSHFATCPQSDDWRKS